MNACPDTDAILAFAHGQAAAPLRERIAMHVDECGDCSALVREALADNKTLRAAEGNESIGPRAPQRGTSIGRYIVIDPLGRGGLGEVYAAYDPELDRRVAIKLLTRRLDADPEFERRLVREGRALAKVTHPHVVAIYDVGTFGDRVFIAMELVRGATLAEWLDAAPRTWQQIRDVMLGAAAGLEEAHRCGLVHRDFKPSNVLVESSDRAKVLDFGLARAAVALEQDPAVPPDIAASSDVHRIEPALTRTGTVVGTPAYMAPEQMNAAEVDARADQFSFCVACYEALFGVRPFTGRSLAELQVAIAQGVAATPRVDRRVPTWLRRAVVRGLAANPSERHASMTALARAMAADPRAPRSPWIVVAAAAALAGGVVWASRPQPAPASSTAADEVDRLTNEARAAAARSYFVYPPSDEPEYPTAHRVLMQLDAVADPAGRGQAVTLRREFADTLVRLADRLWDSEGGAPFARDYYAQALVFDPEISRASERAMLTHGELVTLRAKADDLSFTPAELAAAEPLAVLAAPDETERRRRLAALYDRAHAPSLTATARLEGVLGEEVTRAVHRSTKKTPRSVVAPRPAEPEEKPQELPVAEPEAPVDRKAPKYNTGAEYRAAGRAALKAGRFGEAESLLGRALELDRNDAEAAHSLAELHFERGEIQGAIGFAERAVRARPKNARHRLLLGDCLRKDGRMEEARAQYSTARTLGSATAETRLAKLGVGGSQ